MTKEKMFEENTGIAYRIALNYRDCGIEQEDLEQICLYALWKAVRTYKVEKGYTFSTYAYRVIQNELNYYLRKNRRHFAVKSIQESISKTATIEDTIEDKFNAIENIENQIDMKNSLEKAFEKIKNEKHKRIMILHLNQCTQNKIAEIMGISQAQVSRTLNKYKEMMRTSL